MMRFGRSRGAIANKAISSGSWAPGRTVERRSATRHGEHHRNARRLDAYALATATRQQPLFRDNDIRRYVCRNTRWDRYKRGGLASRPLWDFFRIT